MDYATFIVVSLKLSAYETVKLVLMYMKQKITATMRLHKRPIYVDLPRNRWACFALHLLFSFRRYYRYIYSTYTFFIRPLDQLTIDPRLQQINGSRILRDIPIVYKRFSWKKWSTLIIMQQVDTVKHNVVHYIFQVQRARIHSK